MLGSELDEWARSLAEGPRLLSEFPLSSLFNDVVLQHGAASGVAYGWSATIYVI